MPAPTPEQALQKLEDQIRMREFGEPTAESKAAEAQKNQEWKQTHPDSKGYIHDKALELTQKAIQSFSHFPGPNDPARQQLQEQLEQRFLHRAPAASAAQSTPEREEAIHAIEIKLRKQMGGDTDQGKLAEFDKSWKQSHPGSQGYMHDFAARVYDDPNQRAMLLGNEAEQLQGQANLANQSLQSSRDKFANLAAHAPAGSIQQQLFSQLAGMIEGTHPGMQPQQEAPSVPGNNAPAPYESRPQGISAEDIKMRGHALEHNLADFIRQHQQETPTHVVDLGRIAARNPNMYHALEDYGRWENRRAEMNAHSQHPDPISPDLALIRQNNYAAFVGNHTADAGGLNIAPQEARQYNSLKFLSDEADKTGQTMESFGIMAKPQRSR